MDKYTRYVLHQLIVAMVLVSVGLTSVIWLTQSVQFIDMIVNRGLTAGTFLYLTMLLLPNFLSIILPIALFTVVVFIYSKLIADHELVIMRAAGCSQFNLAKPAIIMALGVMIVGYALNIYLLPQSYRMFKELQWEIRFSYSHVLLQEGVFNNIADGITVYVRSRNKAGELLGVFVYDERNQAKPVTLMAERGAMIRGDNGSRVLMLEGNRHEVNKETNKLSILYFDKYILDLKKTSSANAVHTPEARELSISELFDIEKNEHVGVNDHGKFTIEGHRRLISPISAIAFTLIGVACLLSRYHHRGSRIRQTATAVGIVVALQVGQLALENLTAKNLALLPVLYVAVAIPVLVGWAMLLYSGKSRSFANA